MNEMHQALQNVPPYHDLACSYCVRYELPQFDP